MAVHAIATVPFFSFFHVVPELFLGKDELDKIACQREEDGAMEIVSLLQIVIFFSMRSNRWLNDQPHVSSPLIFVGPAKIGSMFKPYRIASSCFKNGE